VGRRYHGLIVDNIPELSQGTMDNQAREERRYSGQDVILRQRSATYSTETIVCLRHSRNSEKYVINNVCRIYQQMRNSDNLLIHSTAPTYFDVCTPSSGSFLLCVLLSYIKNIYSCDVSLHSAGTLAAPHHRCIYCHPDKAQISTWHVISVIARWFY
jgi:hypothetical protein